MQKLTNVLIPLSLVTVSHNPRKPLRTLQEMGFDTMVFCHEFGLSNDPERREHFVSSIREYEPAIALMAESIKDNDQIQPIVVRDFRTQVGNGYITHYGIACGERRYISCVFNQALTNEPTPVLANIRSMTVKEAYWLGCEENLIREPMTEIEKGQIFHQYAEENGKKVRKRGVETITPLPMTEVAKHFHVEYSYARGRAALATNLSEERIKLYQEGKLNLSDAIKEALGEPSHESKPPREKRRTPLTMKKLEKLFDETDKNDQVRLSTLAEVMQIDLTIAIEESKIRTAS